jgi:hypothetical protein
MGEMNFSVRPGSKLALRIGLVIRSTQFGRHAGSSRQKLRGGRLRAERQLHNGGLQSS